jgi:hypothetical protein
MSNTANTPEDLVIMATTPAGNTYQVAVYVDPFPGRKGAEVLKETCGRCGGDGVIHYGNVTLKVGKVSGRVCFMCMGAGFTTRKVSSARSTARRQAAAQTARNAAAADFAATADERATAELLADWDEALQEQARRAALVSGFIAEEGVRVRNLKATVQVNHQFETTDFHGRLDYKNLLILEAEDGKIIKAVVPFAKVERGQEVTVTGTVKAHATYKGQDQTVLQRVILK